MDFSINKVLVVAMRKDFKPLCGALKNSAAQALFYLKKSGVALEVYLVPSGTMRKLNKTYRFMYEATDVLSFGMPKHFILPKTLFRPMGEIYLSPEHIKKEKGDIMFLTIHGILHLLGYDHVRVGDMIKMQKQEKFLMKKLSRPNC